MMKNILLIQFRTKKSELLNEKRCFQRYFGRNKLKTINAFSQKNGFLRPEKTLEGIGGVILGGSSEFNFAAGNPGRETIFQKMIKKVKPLIRYLFEKDIPVLGICLGHQFLGYVLGAKVVNDKKQQGTGSFPVFLTKQGKADSLFAGIPSVFISQFGHKDSLEKLPPKAVLLSKTKKCKVAAFRYKNNIYGVQFHPELTMKDLTSRLKAAPDYLASKKISEIKKTLKTSPYSPKIFKNFLKITYAY